MPQEPGKPVMNRNLSNSSKEMKNSKKDIRSSMNMKQKRKSHNTANMAIIGSSDSSSPAPESHTLNTKST